MFKMRDMKLFLLVSLISLSFVLTSASNYNVSYYNDKLLATSTRMYLQADTTTDSTTGPVFSKLNGMNFAYQMPPQDIQVTGLLILFHGCKHSGSDSWPESEACPFCLGLPENMRIVKIALARGYAVVAPDSFNRKLRCWSTSVGPRRGNIDGILVPKIVNTIISLEPRLNNYITHSGGNPLPIYVLGASNGGAFALLMPHFMEIHGVVSQIRTINPDWLVLSDGRRYPPTAFVHMPRDGDTATKVQENLAALRAQGTPAEAIEILPRPVTADWLMSQSPETFSREVAESIIDALQLNGIIHADGYLVNNPRKDESWRADIDALGLLAPQSPFRCKSCSALPQLLNLAYAKHEISADGMVEVFEWLENGGHFPDDDRVEYFAVGDSDSSSISNSNRSGAGGEIVVVHGMEDEEGDVQLMHQVIAEIEAAEINVYHSMTHSMTD